MKVRKTIKDDAPYLHAGDLATGIEQAAEDIRGQIGCSTCTGATELKATARALETLAAHVRKVAIDGDATVQM